VLLFVASSRIPQEYELFTQKVLSSFVSLHRLSFFDSSFLASKNDCTCPSFLFKKAQPTYIPLVLAPFVQGCYCIFAPRELAFGKEEEK